MAQVCLAWEALNWNYRNFFRQNPNPKEMGKPYCPAKVAQEFQQFQVLLQRFIENEPYEHGRRPEVYARMKVHSPKLLLVPEFTGTELHSDTGPVKAYDLVFNLCFFFLFCVQTLTVVT